MTRVLVTGATGALGRAFIKHAYKVGGYQTIAAGRQCSNDSSTSVQCDVRDQTQLLTLFDRVKPDLVLHLAASFTGDLGEAYLINVAPAKHLLDYIKNKGFKTRVILIGSAAEYGVVHPDENPIREDHVLTPVSSYGVSKAWQTQLSGLYAHQGVDVVCARMFNLLGPGVSDKLFAGRLQNQIEEVVAGKKSVIEVGPLDAVRDYISTDEAAAQLLTIAVHGKTGNIYHVASGVPITMREVMLRQLNSYGLSSQIVQESPSLSNRSGYDVPAIYADITKTRKLEKYGNGYTKA